MIAGRRPRPPDRPPRRRPLGAALSVHVDVQLAEPARVPFQQGPVARRSSRLVGDLPAEPQPVRGLLEQPVRDAHDACQRQPELTSVGGTGASAMGSSIVSRGRSSSLTANLANGSSSFQRRSLRYDLRNMSLIGGANWAQQMSARVGSRMIVTRRSNRRRPSSTRSQLAIPSRSPRSTGSSPRSESQRSTSAGRSAGAPGSAEGMARGV